ncbi:hypothetical protein RHMOL_Rhmol07G0210400 [Rhododendron molle]|uniref:Uncharacterized protein n=1 Tax=Rhododendron molle TaxID=49168 RepID=A0ACC0N483_RHOML|nr:hypothetical protein RHMOL_Rhmol07G0210400 [Rhododendron molle]
MLKTEDQNLVIGCFLHSYHQNCYCPSKRESTKQFHNSKIKFPLVYGASSQEEMLVTVRIFFILLVILLRIDDDDDVRLIPLL